MLEQIQIEKVMCSAMSLSQKVEKLIELANTSGGDDNITVVLVEIQ
jgi:serine/threonine protein phosphatase PrpC